MTMVFLSFALLFGCELVNQYKNEFDDIMGLWRGQGVSFVVSSGHESVDIMMDAADDGWGPITLSGIPLTETGFTYEGTLNNGSNHNRVAINGSISSLETASIRYAWTTYHRTIDSITAEGAVVLPATHVSQYDRSFR
jgi:hypothetical protein